MEKRRRFSFRQWVKTLAVTVVLVVAMLLVMTQLTGGPVDRTPTPEPQQAEVEPAPEKHDDPAPAEESPSETEPPENPAPTTENVVEVEPPPEDHAEPAPAEETPSETEPSEDPAPTTETVAEVDPLSEDHAEPTPADAPQSETEPPDDPAPATEAIAEVEPPPEDHDEPTPAEQEPEAQAEPPEDPAPTTEAETEVEPPTADHDEPTSAEQELEAQAEPPEDPAPTTEAETEVESPPEDHEPTSPEQEPEAQAESPPESNVESELRERLDERLSDLAAAIEAAEARREQSDPAALTTDMAAAMIDRIEAEHRAQEAAADLETAETLEPDTDLVSDLADDKARQAQAADMLAGVFQALREKVAARPLEPSPSHTATARVGNTLVEHRAVDVMPLDESRRVLSAVGEDDAVFIRSLRWNGQAKVTRDLWIDMGATYALLPPRGSFDPVYRIAGRLDGDATPVEVDQDDFFTDFSNRYTYLTTGDDARAIKEIEARLLRRCGPCTGYRLTLVWNWETLALILSDARALAREKNLRLPQDVKTIEWLALPGSRAGRARIDIVRLTGRDGRIYAP